MNRTQPSRSAVRRPARALLLSATAIAVAHPASAAAAELLFATDRQLQLEDGRRTSQTSGLTQIRLESGAVLSFVDSADYRINADETVDLYAGSVTVAGADGEVTVIRMPDGVEGRVGGAGSAASFSVSADGESRGHALTGEVTIVRGGVSRAFEAGQMWASAGSDSLRQVVSNGAQAAPVVDEDEPQVAALEQGGPLAAAANGLPVSLGDALAAAGASGDILGAARRVEAAAANPDIATFPTGDVALLVSYAAQLQAAYGAQAFPGSQADIVRAYLGYLARGGAGADFLAAYGGILAQYLDLVRAGALPANVAGASVADINAFIAYTGRTSGFAALSAPNRELVEAYLAFLAGGGDPTRFASSYTDLVEAYFAFLRSGGDPLAFAGASEETLAAYIAFLADSGLAVQLSAADQALLESYLASGGLAFADQYRAALDAYFAFLAAGNLPSAYTGLDAATLRAYLEALQRTGLFADILGAQGEFYAALLAHLQAGGALDAFAGLNANVFAGYAGALDAYYGYLLEGGQPSAYAALTQQQVAAYVAALQAAGASGAFLDDLDEFYAGYSAYLAEGGNPDVYTGLPVLNLPAFADALNAYAGYLAGGGLPSGYGAVDLAALSQYLNALSRSGQLAALLGTNAGLLNAYFAHLSAGGGIDRYSGLPIYAGYVSALQAYFAHLDAGGLPASYTALTAAQVRDYLAALSLAGGLSAQLGALAEFFTPYYAYLVAGGAPEAYAGLPVYGDYVSALNAYHAFLASGGLPSAYTALTQQQIGAYLAALQAAGGLSAYSSLASFFGGYQAFLAGGGDPQNYSGLPIYAGYVSALNAYHAFLEGGGLPSAYTALTQQQIASYLSALQAAGGFAAHGSLASFFGGYQAFLAGGGDPQNYSGLPVYAGYVSALNAYHAFLAGGGLPGDYTALTPQQIQSYLAALNAAGGFAAHGSLASFFGGYHAFLAGGGDPAEYAGIPVYANYLAALQAYYNFLAGGGLPSAYAALTTAQVQAYIAALDASGILDAQLDDEERGFVLDYYAYLLSGADPDDFAGLPANDPGATLLAGANTWIFSSQGGQIAVAETSDIDAEGRIARTDLVLGTNNVVTFDYTGSENTLREHGRVGESVAWTRYERGASAGVSNFNVHLLTGAPAVDLPASGTVDYRLIGGTAPANVMAPAGEIGAFSGNLAVAFGASPRVGLDFDVHVGTRGWRAQTPGGAAGAATGGLVVNGEMRFQNLDLQREGIAGNACAGYCNVQVFGGLFGEGAANAGFQYHIDDQSSGGRSYINGTAVFGVTGTELPLIGAMPATGSWNAVPAPVQLVYAGGFDPQDPRVDFVTTLRITGGAMVRGRETGYNATSYQLDGSGGLNSYTRSGGVSRTRGSASVAEASGNANALIGRWTNGVTTGANPFTLDANQGFHYLIARPVPTGFSLPTVGTIHYDLLAATRPTMIDGSVAPGGMAADMALVLGTAPKVAFEAAFTMPGWAGGANELRQYATTGGLTNPSQSTTAISNIVNGRFTFIVPGVTGTDCVTGTCLLNVDAIFAGGSEQIGLTYEAQNDQGAAKNLIGAALFGNGTLTGGPVTPTEPTLVTANLFSAEARLNSSYDAYNTHPLNLSVTSAPGSSRGYELDEDGDIVGVRLIGTYGGHDRIGTAENVDSGATAGGLRWTRWTNGTLSMGRNVGAVTPVTLSESQGYHFIAGAPATNIPTSGRVDYELAGGTKPTQEYGAAAPGSLVSGAAAVQFGAQPKVGIELAFDYNANRYTAQTTGGLADLSTSELNLVDGAFYAIGAFGNVTGGTCAAACRAIWTGFLSGDQGREMGLEYIVQLGNSNNEVIGTAAFVAGSGTGAPPTGFTGTRTGQVSYGFYNGSLANAWGGTVTYTDGRITSFPSAYGEVAATTAEVAEGGLLDDIGWVRWANGMVENALVGVDRELSATEGYHVFSGSPTMALPTSGRVDYELSGSTGFTDNRGSTPGTLTGDLAIQFGTTARVGLELQAEVGGMGWNVATTGGVANPGSSQFQVVTGASGTTFGGQINNATGTGGACSIACIVSVSGALFGANAAHAAVALNVVDLTASTQASGVAIFSASGAPAPSNPYATVPQATSAADWSGFEGLSADQVGIAPANLSAGLPLSAGDASALFGGAITFAGQ